MSLPCLCGGLCPAHAPYNRFRVFYHHGYKSWAVMAPHGTGKGKLLGSHAEAVAYADNEARR
jgi:hypothetical protein